MPKKKIEDMELPELFAEADRIGNKYQTPKERKAFKKKLKEINDDQS